MQQITLELDRDEDDRPPLTLNSEREQRLITLMAQIIVAIVQQPGGAEHDAE